MILENFRIILDYEVSVDPETGVVEQKCVKKALEKGIEIKKTSTKKSKKVDDGGKATLTLEDKKYILSPSAVELMGVEPDDKLDIKYTKVGKDMLPVIGTDEAFGTHSGNRLTKSLTVAYRGSKHDELAKYGTEFILIPNESKEGTFILKGDESELDKVLEETAELPVIEEDLELPIDVDIQEFIDDEDANITEVDPSIFKL